MVANIAQINGKDAMAYNVENGLPWHSLGQPLVGRKGKAEMKEAAQLDWDVIKTPLLTYGIAGTPSGQALYPVPGRMAINRVHADGTFSPLATVGETYVPIQNEELFDFADALFETDGSIVFETAGALNGGRVVFVLAALPENAITIDGDPQGKVMPYLILSTGHDGLRAFSAAPTPVRVVCQNTLNMAMAGARDIYTIRHTVRAPDYLQEARNALKVNIEQLETLRKVSAQLMKRRMTINDIWAATEKLIPSLAETPEKATKAIKQREALVSLYQNSTNLDGVPFTAYRFVQAAAEYADHVKEYRATKRGTSEDARALAILGGVSLDLKNEALKLVLPEAAKRGPKGQFVKVTA
jgi:phage/plasmid-like protein (TIGR03299 family)